MYRLIYRLIECRTSVTEGYMDISRICTYIYIHTYIYIYRHIQTHRVSHISHVGIYGCIAYTYIYIYIHICTYTDMYRLIECHTSVT